MIQHFDKKVVSNNTLTTGQVEILSTPIDRCAREKALLKAEIAMLHQHNQVLQNCWQEAKLDYSKAVQDLRAYIEEIGLLQKEVEELQTCAKSPKANPHRNEELCAKSSGELCVNSFEVVA